MRSFTHKPEIVAFFNNDMGILIDSLPKKLENMGITGMNRKACYKYYFKRGTPLCKAEFDNQDTAGQTLCVLFIFLFLLFFYEYNNVVWIC